MSVTLISGDARKIPLADESVQCIVTSPPYWGLRKYAGEQELVWGSQTCFTAETGPHPEHIWQEERRNGISGGQNQNSKAENGDGATNRPLEPSTHGTCARCGAWRGAYGLEPTVEMYVAHSLEILRELRRVLRKDGVLFWNLGDSYAAGKAKDHVDSLGYFPSDGFSNRQSRLRDATLKPKDLVLMPARIALAAQADGWWVRSVIIWAKPNPMPESVTDRPTDSYEHILMLTKSARYFWDADAVREKAETGWNGSSFTDERDAEVYANLGRGPRNANGYKPGHDARDGKERFCSGTGGYQAVSGTRNMRNLWEFPTQPYAGAHFATFPEELPRRCILAATSARGCCAQCGAPWERVLRVSTIGMGDWVNKAETGEVKRMQAEHNAASMDGTYQRETVGWTPTCRCRGQRGKTEPCVVLDPFGGSGTTGRVAIELGRRAVLLDLAYGRETDEDRAKGRSYAALAKERTSNVQNAFPLL